MFIALNMFRCFVIMKLKLYLSYLVSIFITKALSKNTYTLIMATSLAKSEENVAVPIQGPRVKGESMKAVTWYVCCWWWWCM